MNSEPIENLKKFYQIIAPHITGHKTASALFWDSIKSLESEKGSELLIDFIEIHKEGHAEEYIETLIKIASSIKTNKNHGKKPK